MKKNARRKILTSIQEKFDDLANDLENLGFEGALYKKTNKELFTAEEMNIFSTISEMIWDAHREMYDIEGYEDALI